MEKDNPELISFIRKVYSHLGVMFFITAVWTTIVVTSGDDEQVGVSTIKFNPFTGDIETSLKYKIANNKII